MTEFDITYHIEVSEETMDALLWDTLPGTDYWRDGEFFDVNHFRDLYHSGAFVMNGRPPKARFISDEGSQSGCSLSRNSASLIGSPKLTQTWPKRCLSAPMTLKMSKIDSFFLLAPRNSPR